MALPTMTAQQRTDALQKAAAARKERSALLRQIRQQTTTVAAVLNRADNPVIAKTKLRQVLEAAPGWGKATVANLMQRLQIPVTRRVGGLGTRQREALIAEFTRRSSPRA